MKADTKGEFDEDQPQNPKILEDYYEVELDDIIHYDRDDARGFILQFRVVDEDVELLNDYNLEWDDGEIVLPFFAPGNLSKSEDSMSSRLTEQLEKLGLHEAVLDILDHMVEVKTGVDDDGEPVFEEMSAKEAVLEDFISLKARDEDDAEELANALRGVLKGKKIRADVKDNQSGDESQVSEFSRVVDSDSSSGDTEEDSGDEEKEVLFDDDEEEEETDKDGEDV